LKLREICLRGLKSGGQSAPPMPVLASSWAAKHAGPRSPTP